MTFSAAEFDERYRNITLRLTCSACPEQYDAFIGDRKVGYLRLRWGEFRVDYSDCGGEMIYCHVFGDPLQGTFDSDEQRAHHLELAKTAIRERLARSRLARP